MSSGRPDASMLTHSCPEISLTSIVWTCDTVDNKFGIGHTTAKYLKESYRRCSEEHLSFKYFLKTPFFREIEHQKSKGDLAASDINGLIHANQTQWL